MADLVSAILVKLAASLAVTGIKAGYQKLTTSPAFKKATDETKAAFPEIELGPALRKWCESQQFEVLISSMSAGGRAFADDSIIDPFIGTGEFYAGENTRSMAGQVLALFFQKLEAEIIRSPDGLVAVAGRQEVLHEQTRAAFQDSNRQIVADVGEMNAKMTAIQSSLSDKSVSPQEVQERILHARVDEARAILESGKPKTARERLETIRREIAGTNPSQSILFRIATNLGSCAIQLDDKETSIREIQFAYNLEPDNPKAIANASLVTLLQRRPQEALGLASRARAMVPRDSVATANYIQALFALGRDAELPPLLESEEWIQSDVNCCFAIGNLLFNKERYADAEQFLRSAHKAEPDEPRVLVLLAHSLIRPTQQALIGQPILDWRFPAEFLTRLDEAQTLLTQAIAIQESMEDRRFFGSAHVLRADVRRMLGNEAEAIADCEAALSDNPADEFAHQIKALSLLHLGRLDEAIASFEKVTSSESKEQMLLPLAAAYSASGRPAKVVELLAPRWNAEAEDAAQLTIADLLLCAYEQLSDAEAVEGLTTKIRSRWPSHPDALVALARQFRRRGNKEASIGLFSEAFAYASGPRRDFIALELADLLYSEGEFAKAADLYGSVADLSSSHDVTRRYLVCLFNTGAYKEALSLARRIRNEGEPLHVVSHIEAKVLIEIGDLHPAQELLERLAQLNPKIHSYRIDATECAIRRAQPDSAKTLLSGLAFEDIRNDGKALLRVAQLRALLGMGEVLKFAYQARRAAFSDPEIHAAYAALFVSREQVDSILLDRQVAEADCAVILKTPAGQASYTILDENDLQVERGEITSKQAEEMKLMGRKKGDQFVPRKSMWQDVECTVVEVQSKYVRAFQETLEKFPTLFPTTPLLQPVHGTYNEFKEGMLRQLDQNQINFGKVIAFYETKKLSIEALAQIFNRPLIEMWGLLSGGRYCKLAAFSGQVEEAQREYQSLAKADTIVLELTSLLTFAQLGLLDRLSRRFKSLLSVQPVLDSVIEALAENTLSKPHLTIGKVGEDYVKDEVTPERLAANKRFLEGIRDFLSSQVTIVPVASSLDIKGPRLAELKEIVGPISVSCVLAALEREALLVSDDEMLRALARNDWKVSGVWTQSVLQELRRATALTQEEYVEAVAKLVLFNYRFVSINSEVVLWILSRTDFKITSEAKKFFAVFRAPECTLESAVGVLADVTKRVWLEAALYETKLDILDEILGVIVTVRPTEQAVELFTRVTRASFYLMPRAVDAIERHIGLWHKRQMDRAGLIHRLR